MAKELGCGCKDDGTRCQDALFLQDIVKQNVKTFNNPFTSDADAAIAEQNIERGKAALKTHLKYLGVDW